MNTRIKTPRGDVPQSEYEPFKCGTRSYKWTAAFVKFVSEHGMPPEVYAMGSRSRCSFNDRFRKSGGRYKDDALYDGANFWTPEEENELKALFESGLIRRHGVRGCVRKYYRMKDGE